MMPIARVLLINLVIIIVISSLVNAETTIPFDEPPGTIPVATRYSDKGVLLPLQARIISLPLPYTESTSKARSGTNVLLSRDLGNEFDQWPLIIQFTHKVQWVKLYTGVTEDTGGNPVHVTLKAFNESGNLVDEMALDINGYSDITTEMNVKAPSGQHIRKVELEYERAFFEFVDDLTFLSMEEPPKPPTDTIPPTVTITNPNTDGQVFYTMPSINLEVVATDKQTGVGALQLICYGDGGIELSSGYICGGPSAGPVCQYTSANREEVRLRGTTFFFPSGTKTIRVKAFDFAGNAGHADRHINFKLPGPNMNLWAMGMEITQGIQLYIAKNEDKRKQITPTFNYRPEAKIGKAVPLVADRHTVVRLYAGVEGTNNGVPVDVDARLHCFLDPEFTKPCSGPYVVNAKASRVKPSDNLNTKRIDPSLSWNFVLPKEWIKKADDNKKPRTIHLEAEINAPFVLNECGGCYDEANLIRMKNIDLWTVPDFTKLVRLVRITRIIEGESGPHTPTVGQTRRFLDFLRKTYPVDETTVPYNTDTRTWNQTESGRNREVLGFLNDNFKNDNRTIHAFVDVGGGGSGAMTGNSSYARINTTAETSAHEIGHAFRLDHAGSPPGHGSRCADMIRLGRPCAECNPEVGGRCDNDWPWPHGTIGGFGFDVLDPNLSHVFPPATTANNEADFHDFMSYGAGALNAWVSPRNWTRLFNAFTTGEDFPYQKAYNGGTGVTFSETMVRYLFVRGWLADDTWILLPAYELELPLHTDNDSHEDEYRIELLDDSGQIVSVHRFSLTPVNFTNFDPYTEHMPPSSFSEVVPLPNEAVTVVLRRGSEKLASVSRSKSLPTIEILSPTEDGFEEHSEKQVIRWKGHDDDRDPLYYMVQYKDNQQVQGKADWETLAVDLTDEELAVSFDDLPGSDEAIVRVLATDGFNTGVAVSQAFVVPDKPPRAHILLPSTDMTIREGDWIALRGTASDLEDGLVNLNNLSWYSDQNGFLGNGRKIDVNTLSPGTHNIAFVATDSDGQTGMNNISIDVSERINTQPKADAGPDQTVNIGKTIQLNGTGSSDFDGDPLVFHWSIITKPPGSSPKFTDHKAEKPEFFTDREGDYEIELIVNDGQVASFPDNVFVHVTESIIPDVFTTEGKVTLLRVHDLGTMYGQPEDKIDIEVVIKLDSQPDKAFGFQLRKDKDESVHRHMLDLLREAFNRDRRVKIDYINNGLHNFRIIRVMNIR